MTAVVGILNKKGIALAADSAVTRNRWGYREKVTKNGNKLVRLSDAVPVSVMFTGNGCFLNNPWDVVARRYRQERGNIPHSTVESCMQDFFEYISNNRVFWNDNVCNESIEYTLKRLLERTNGEIPYDVESRKKDGTVSKPALYKKTFISKLRKFRKEYQGYGKGKLFENYTIENFVNYAGKTFDQVIEEYTESESFHPHFQLPASIMDDIKDDLRLTLFEYLTCRLEDDSYAELIFSGYGKDEQYPSLVNVIVNEGFDNIVNYHYHEKDVIRISDERPVAYCPFAQRDISRSLVRGCHRSFSAPMLNEFRSLFAPWGNQYLKIEGLDDMDIWDLYNRINTDDLEKILVNPLSRLQDSNLKHLEKNLKDYDVLAMAELAESVIDLTGFHRILTFQQEGVGGPVDVAVITKNDGFTWISRKSWYHHKDVNGMYGSMGI